jgi:hypothetical protein
VIDRLKRLLGLRPKYPYRAVWGPGTRTVEEQHFINSLGHHCRRTVDELGNTYLCDLDLVAEIEPFVRKSERRRRAAYWLLAVMVLMGLASWNAYDAGRRVGYQKGYDEASVAEAIAWRAVPRPEINHQNCERYLFEHSQVVRE